MPRGRGGEEALVTWSVKLGMHLLLVPGCMVSVLLVNCTPWEQKYYRAACSNSIKNMCHNENNNHTTINNILKTNYCQRLVSSCRRPVLELLEDETYQVLYIKTWNHKHHLLRYVG